MNLESLRLKIMKTVKTTAVLSVLFGIAALSEAQFFPMGFLPNSSKFPNSQAYGITKDGVTVVGYSYVDIKDKNGQKATVLTATTWDTSNGLLPLTGHSPYNSIGSLSQANFVNYNSSVILCGGLVWDQALVSPFGDRNTQTSGIAPDASFIVGGEGPVGTTIAFKLAIGGAITLLPGISGMPVSSALASSDQGKVIVGGVNLNMAPRAVYWDSKGVHLIPFPAQYLESEASAVNSEGTIIAGITADSKASYGFFYHPGEKEPYLIYSSPSGFPIGIVTGIADDGSLAVGEAGDSAGDNFGFVWDANSASSAQLASGFLAANGAAPTKQINIVHGCSADGQTLCGDMSDDQGVTPEGWIAKLDLPVKLASATVNPNPMPSNSHATGTVLLTRATKTERIVTITTDDFLLANIQGTAYIAPGERSQTFKVASAQVLHDTLVTFTAKIIDVGEVTGSFTIQGSPLTNLVISPTSVVGGNGATGTITLAAGQGAGFTAGVTSSSGSAHVPGTVKFATGSKTATFAITTDPVKVSTSATITTTVANVSRLRTLTILPDVVLSIGLNGSSVVGGSNVMATVTLAGPAYTGGAVVSLKSSDILVAGIPTSITVPAGKKAAQFSFTTKPVSGSVNVTYTATYGGVSKAAILNVKVAAPTSVTFVPTSVVGGKSVTATVHLATPAGPTGDIVSMKSSSAYAKVPASVTIPKGAYSVSFTVTTTKPNASASAVITATLASSTAKGTLTITP